MTATKTSLTGRSVLLVEDEYFIADDIARQLEAGGARVVGPAPSVDAALGLIEQTERIDGAIVDVNLQGEMSWPVVDALLERGVRVAFSTGYDSASIPVRYAEIVRYEKPIDLGETARALFGRAGSEPEAIASNLGLLAGAADQPVDAHAAGEAVDKELRKRR